MAIGQADNRRRVVALRTAFDRQQTPDPNREGDCQHEGSTGDAPIEKGGTDGDVPGPAGIAYMGERGETSEHVIAPNPVTTKKGRRGATEPEDTDKPEDPCHGVESQIGRFG
jgi:hypothetical protein